ncbi:MAG: hypothetical protein AAYR33_09595 [Acetobacteraceae bacterium]
MTEGLFPRRVLTDPFLEGVATVIFDEVHERSLELDTGLALALSAQRNLRETLRIIAMSASLEGDAFSQLMRAAQITCGGGGNFHLPCNMSRATSSHQTTS